MRRRQARFLRRRVDARAGRRSPRDADSRLPVQFSVHLGMRQARLSNQFACPLSVRFAKVFLLVSASSKGGSIVAEAFGDRPESGGGGASVSSTSLATRSSIGSSPVAVIVVDRFVCAGRDRRDDGKQRHLFI